MHNGVIPGMYLCLNSDVWWLIIQIWNFCGQKVEYNAYLFILHSHRLSYTTTQEGCKLKRFIVIIIEGVTCIALAYNATYYPVPLLFRLIRFESFLIEQTVLYNHHNYASNCVIKNNINTRSGRKNVIKSVFFLFHK